MLYVISLNTLIWRYKKMKTILQITPSGARVADLYGDGAVRTPELILFSRTELLFDLRSSEQDESGRLAPLVFDPASVLEWYFAIDSSFDSDTPPKLLVTGGITVDASDGGTVVKVSVPGSATSTLVEDMRGKQQQNYICEIGGFDSDGCAVVTWQFEIAVKNRIYPGNVPPEVASDPQYLTALQVKALISSVTGFTAQQLAEI